MHPVKTVHCVAERLHISVRTVEKWFAGASPSLKTWGAILHAYGPEFVEAGMTCPPAWLSEAARRAKRQRLDAQLSAIEAEIAAEALGERDAP